MKKNIVAQLKDSSKVLAATAKLAPEIERAAEALIAAYRRGNKILVSDVKDLFAEQLAPMRHHLPRKEWSTQLTRCLNAGEGVLSVIKIST